MTDARLRDLERRFRKTGAVEDEAAWLRERVRAGELAPERLEMAARCGYLPAGLAADLEAEAGRMGAENIFLMLPEIQEVAGDLALVIAASAAARLVLHLWEQEFPADRRGRDAIELSEAWARSPDKAHIDLLHERTRGTGESNLLIDASARPKRDPVGIAGKALNNVTGTVSGAYVAAGKRLSYLFAARGAVGKSADLVGEEAVREAMCRAVGRYILESYQPKVLYTYAEEQEEKAREAERRAQEEAARLAAIPPRRYSPAEHFEVGERVTHPKFGQGEVVRSAGKLVEIEFADGTRRKLAEAR